MERIENLARLLDVTKTFAAMPTTATGCRCCASTATRRVLRALSRRRARTASARFYLLDADNSSSVQAAIAAARENARTLRALISTEMWLQINVFHGRIRALTEDDLAPDRLSAVCAMLKEGAQAHTGITEGTFYRDQCWHFYMIGRYLERADQTTRLLDTRFNRAGAAARGSARRISTPASGTRCCAPPPAIMPIAASTRTATGRVEVAGFLLVNTAFPALGRTEPGAARVASDAVAPALPPARRQRGAGAGGRSEHLADARPRWTTCWRAACRRSWTGCSAISRCCTATSCKGSAAAPDGPPPRA